MLERGIEWVYRKTKVQVVFNGNYLDVLVHPNVPKETYPIQLMINISEKAAYIDDLVRNGYGAEYCNSGYGTLAMNIAIQALYVVYEIEPGCIDAQNISVAGEVVPTGDPEGPAGHDCRDRRNHFWSSFGLVLDEPDQFEANMRASLADLHLKIGGLTSNGTPKTVELENFWETGK